MNEPIYIKTKKIFSKPTQIRFDKAKVLDNLEKDIISHWGLWSKFQQAWLSSAYNTFRDLDKYVVMLYLLRDYWQNLSDKFMHMSMDSFYELDDIIIEKINLITISSELNIPKETIRRKINELQKDGILRREGKQIILDKTCLQLQKPKITLAILTKFIHINSYNLRGEAWFGSEISQENVKQFIVKYFTIMWLRFLKLQIPFLIRHRNIFRDIETYVVWGNVASNHQYHLEKANNENLVKDEVLNSNYLDYITNIKIKRGVNASSIADISRIPRATVIRKLKWLEKEKVLKKNKKVEYLMARKGKVNKQIAENFKLTRVNVAEFLTDIFDYIKNSNFKI